MKMSRKQIISSKRLRCVFRSKVNVIDKSKKFTVTGGKSAKTSLRTQVRAFVVNDPIQMLLGVYPYFIWIMPIVKPYIYFPRAIHVVATELN